MADTEAEVDEKPVVADEPVDSVVPPAWVDARAVGTAPAPNGSTVDDLVVNPAQSKALQDRLVEIKRAQMSSAGGAADETVSRLRRDRAQMEDAFKQTALAPDALQPWDQKAKQNEYRTDPVEAFGSVGSVFAMLASSFAGVPMEYALEAGAAAINAVHKQDEKAYERDFTSWKENTQLALKRHDIMRQAYNDSILKMNTNLNAGRSEMEMSARKFGDQQALALLEAGLDPELNKLIDARNKSALELQKTSDDVWLQHEKTMDLKKDPGFLSGNPVLKQQAVQAWQERWRAGGRAQTAYDAEKDFVETYKKENPDWTSSSLTEAVGGFRKSMAEAEAAGIPVGTGKMTGPQLKEAERKKYEDDVRKEHPEFSETQVLEESRRRQRIGSPPELTSAQQGRYEDRTFLADHTSSILDKQIDRLQRRSGLTGVGGIVTRGKERIGNIFGSTEVEAQEFYKDLEEMRLNAGRMLTMSAGRPLATEAARINAVLKGNSIGDLTAPTLAAMRDYHEFVKKFKADSASRLQRNPTPSMGGSGSQPTGAPSAPKRKPWEKDPVVSPAPGQRSSVESDPMMDVG